MIVLIAAVGWAVAGFALVEWHYARLDAERCDALRDALRASERECDRVREAGLRAVDMWEAADKKREAERALSAERNAKRGSENTHPVSSSDPKAGQS